MTFWAFYDTMTYVVIVRRFNPKNRGGKAVAGSYVSIMKKSIRLTTVELILSLIAFVSHIGGIAIASQAGSLAEWSTSEFILTSVVLILLTITIAVCAAQLNNPRKDRTMPIIGFVVLSASTSAVLCIAGLCAQTELPVITETARAITLLMTAASTGVAIHFPSLTELPSLREELEED